MFCLNSLMQHIPKEFRASKVIKAKNCFANIENKKMDVDTNASEAEE